MEFKIDKSALNDGIRKVSRAISARTIMPILSGILVSVTKDTLILTGSSSDLTIRVTIPSDNQTGLSIIQIGSIVLPAKELANIVRSLPNDSISFKDNAGVVTITGGKSNFKLKGQSSNEFPAVAPIQNESIKVMADVLGDMIQKTIFCVSKLESRPVLTGVNLSFDNNKLGMVSTDSHRLARSIEADFEGEGPEDSVTVPATSLKEVPALMGKEVTISTNQKQIFLKG